MKVAVLIVDVEISDQYGTSEKFVVGVFTDPRKLEAAKAVSKEQYRHRRTFYQVQEVELDVVAP